MKQKQQFEPYQQITDYKVGMVLPDEITVLYVRLSNEDRDKCKKEDDSDSIVNQKRILANHTQKLGLHNRIFFTDDDYTGTNFERPDFQAAWELVKAGRVKNFVVKDLSRFGRSNALVGYYTEYVLPSNNVRFIAIGDNVDDTTGESDIKTQFTNMYNEHHPRETSRKVKEYFVYKGTEGGLPLCNTPPYGYKKDPETKLWIIDEPAAEIVRQIFRWCMEGLGPKVIADRLREMQVEVPRVHAANAGIRKCNQIFDPYYWGYATIVNILARREYLGHIINFKTYQKSFKHKKRLQNAPEKLVVLENKHPAIIEEDVFERVQQIRSTKRRRSFSGRVNLFQGLGFCADCKGRMNLASGASLKPTQDNYSCSGFTNRKQRCCDSSHYIRRIVLEEMVLEYLQKVTAFATNHENELVQKLKSQNTAQAKKNLAADKKSLALAEKRNRELDIIIQGLIEKNILGVISDERYTTVSQNYETEQKELKAKIQSLKTQLAEEQEVQVNTDSFLALVRKYTQITELSTGMLHELVERVEIHAPDYSSGKRIVQVDVYFNFVGNIGDVWESTPKAILYSPLSPIPAE
jgi:DNA invertase Pin-like site-specific DNA recombinase